MAGFFLKILMITALIISLGVDAPMATETEITKKQLKMAAYNSLWRLKRAIEKNGFYSATVALNVWRSNAIDAGIFDQAQYDDFKKQIYEKSIENSLKCIETSLENQNYTDAGICLHAWQLRTRALGTFDQNYYDQIKDRLASSINDHMNTNKE